MRSLAHALPKSRKTSMNGSVTGSDRPLGRQKDTAGWKRQPKKNASPTTHSSKRQQHLAAASMCLGVDYVEELSLYENYTCAINYLSELIEFAKPFGIKIATCNCHWGNFIHSDPAWSVIHGHLKDLWIKYDPSHSVYANGENYLSE